MKYLIYQLANPSLVVKYIDTNGVAVLTTNENEAMQFDSEDEASSVADTIGGSNFWGTRPVRHGH